MIKINLLDYRRVKKTIKLQKELAIHLLSIVVALGAIGFFWYSQNNQIKEFNRDITHWKAELKAIDKTVKKVDEAKAKKKRIEHILKSIIVLKAQQSEPARLLDEMNINLPAEVWLSKFDETDKTILLEGFSFSDPAIAVFMKNLEKLSKYFVSIELIETRQIKRGQGKLKKFQIRCNKIPKILPPQGEKA